jgi:hypothetical protein
MINKFATHSVSIPVNDHQTATLLVCETTGVVAVHTPKLSGVLRILPVRGRESVVDYLTGLHDFTHLARGLFPKSSNVVLVEETQAAARELVIGSTFSASDVADVGVTDDGAWWECSNGRLAAFLTYRDFAPVEGPSKEHRAMVVDLLPRLVNELKKQQQEKH